MKRDAVSIGQAGRIVRRKNVRQKLPIQSGFVRKGKALVFSTVGEVILSEETVQETLESGRAERDSLTTVEVRQ